MRIAECSPYRHVTWVMLVVLTVLGYGITHREGRLHAATTRPVTQAAKLTVDSLLNTAQRLATKVPATQRRRAAAYQSIADAYRIAGRFKQALAVTGNIVPENMEEVPDRPYFLPRVRGMAHVMQREIVYSMARNGRFDRARRTASNITALDERARAYGRIAQAMVKANRPQQASKALGQAIKVHDQLSDESKYNKVFRHLRRYLFNVGDIDGVYRLTETLDSERWRASSYRWIARQQMEAGDRAAARRSLNKAQRIAPKIQDPVQRCKYYLKEATNLTELRSGATIRAALKKAADAAGRVEGREAGVHLLLDVSEQQIAIGQKESARQTCKKALAAARQIPADDDDTRVWKLHASAAMLAKGGDPEQALRIADGIDVKRIKTATHRRIIQVLAFGRSARGTSWNLAQPYRERDKLTARPDGFEWARRTAGKMAGGEQQVDAYLDLAVATHLNEQPEMAKRMFDRAKEAAMGVKNPDNRVGLLVMIAGYQRQFGFHALVLKTCRGVQKVIADNERPFNWVRVRVAELQAKSGAIKQARATASRIESYSQRGRAFGRIARVLCETGEVDAAIKLSRKVIIGSALRKLHRKIIEHHCKNTRFNAAKRVAARMHDAEARVDEYLSIARAQDEAGQEKTALRTVDEARESAVAIDPSSTTARSEDRRRAVNEVAATLATMGQIDQAIKLTEKAGGNGAYNVIARQQLKAGRLKAARQSADAIHVDDEYARKDQIKLYHDLALAAAKRGNFAAALRTVSKMPRTKRPKLEPVTPNSPIRNIRTETIETLARMAGESGKLGYVRRLSHLMPSQWGEATILSVGAAARGRTLNQPAGKTP